MEHLLARLPGYLASSPHRAALKVVPACYRIREYGDSFVSWRYLDWVLLAIWRELRMRWPSLRHSPKYRHVIGFYAVLCAFWLLITAW